MYEIDKIDKESKRMYIIGKIFTILLYIIIIPIIFYNLTLIIKSCINPYETPDFFGYKNFIIVSGSMEKTIMTGDAIFVKEVPQEEIDVNDIISFQDGEGITTHRIIAKTEENGVIKYTTKGDNNNVEDRQKVVYEQIEGKYQFKINGFGFIAEILKNKLTIIALVLIIILNFIQQRRIQNKKQERKKKRKEYEIKN